MEALLCCGHALPFSSCGCPRAGGGTTVRRRVAFSLSTNAACSSSWQYFFRRVPGTLSTSNASGAEKCELSQISNQLVIAQAYRAWLKCTVRHRSWWPLQAGYRMCFALKTAARFWSWCVVLFSRLIRAALTQILKVHAIWKFFC